VISHKNLPKLLGDQFDPEARYCMVETHASGRAGRFPSVRTATARHKEVRLDPNGSWQSLGEFSDPETDSARRFHIYQWRPQPPLPFEEPLS
jgi:hypothetical protein